MAQFVFGTGYFLVVDTSTATGGVQYVGRKIIRNEREGERHVEEYQATKVVDNEALVAEGTKIVNRARYLLRKHASSTAVGLVCNSDQLKELQGELAPVEREAADFNRRARAAKSARRAIISIVPFEVKVDNIAAARAIARTIRDALTEVSTMINGNVPVKDIRNFWRKYRNIEKLATGMQRFALDDAVSTVTRELRKLSKAQKDGKEYEADLGEVESAIGMFVDLDAVEADSKPALSLVV